MIITAKEMHHAPAKAYREAYKDGKVTINHDRYPDKVFELTARDRAAIKKEDDKSDTEKKKL